MAGIRGAGRRAKNRSRATSAALIGAVLALALLAAGGAVAFFHPWTKDVAQRDQVRLSNKIVGQQAVGLANLGAHGQAGAPGSSAMLLYANAGGLVFTPSSGGQNVQPGQQWQADQMAGGSYVLLFTPDGRCLTAVGRGSQASAQLERCDTRIDQRWDHPFQGTDAAGREYWQLRSAANGRCLALGGTQLGGVSVAALERCAPAKPWQQLIMFWSAY